MKREKKGMSRDSRKNRKLFSFSLAMIIFLASLTTLFVVVPFNAEAEGANAVPTNGEPSYGGWDIGDLMVFPGDNCYAQCREYTITVVYTDKDDFKDLKYVELSIGKYILEPVTTRTTFRYDEYTDTFSQITDGQEKWDLDSTNLDVLEGKPTTNDITVTWRFKPQWDADEESNLGIKLYCCDDQSTSDTDAYSPNFDVVTTLLTNDIESQFEGKPDDRVDISSNLEMAFEVRYAAEPASKVIGTCYPSNSEFTSVSVYRIAEGGTPLGEFELAGTDESIVNGDGTVPFTAPATVNYHDYRLSLDMADADYVDGYLDNLDETVIADRILVNWSANQTTINAGSQVTITLDDIIYDYDNANVGSYQYDVHEMFCDQDKGLVEDDKGSSNFTVVPKIAGVCNYTISSFSESGYGLTANQTNQTISLTVKQSISLVNNSENDGINYITWGATDSIQASELAGASYADLQNGDTIIMFNTTSGNWSNIYTYPEGPEFTINRWNHTRIHCTNAKTFSVTPDGSVNSSQNKTLTYSVANHGYHYYTWSNDFSIKASDFATNSELDLTNQPISVYSPITGKWTGYTEIPGLPQPIKDGMDFYINPYDVICFKVASGTENAYYDSSNYQPT